MATTTDFIAICRQQMLGTLEGLTTEQINQVPTGFNNNLIWNLAHVISAQQTYIYTKADLMPSVDAAFIADYAGKTFPKDHVNLNDIDAIKTLAVTTIDQLKTDIEQGTFNNYPHIAIRPNELELNNIDEALEFILFHDAMHLGTMKALRKAVGG